MKIKEINKIKTYIGLWNTSKMFNVISTATYTYYLSYLRLLGLN